jgi:glyoxylase-like metal-dependent hydrolase (beta-lactamase superfamily II)
MIMPRSAKLGAVDIWQVDEITYKMPLSMMTQDEKLIASLPQWMYPRYIDKDRNFDMVWQSWIMVVDGRVIVVDPCTGNGRNFPDFQLAHMLDTPYIERFAATGIKPEDVDYVFCTHLHMDHCGWNTHLRNGKYVPTFPNARYIMVKREFDRWDTRLPGHKAIPQNIGVFENSVLPVVEAGLAEVVPDRHSITPNLIVEPAYGHTAGHSLLQVKAGSEQVYFVGDAFHHPLEILHPDLDDHTSEDPSQTSKTRHRIIDTCIAQHALVVPAHFPCAFGGHITRTNNTMHFEPYCHAVEPA